ncbi:DNA-binding XRE family transcriptional regulator [Actinomadura coerulea]|uniref:DNA-binding XRE family transcriptional regulator n=1 Tax=Actinomadura coerulea TaxID=46159 RepID=A0A7X0G437_9ACTN|nr:DNA-binding XRE family transcriptional regulator [Actinomadura coerulea]
MGDRADWSALRERRMSEPGAAEAYDVARLAYELGRSVRALREERGWSQSELARGADMTQSAVARFEAGGTVPTLAVLNAWPELSVSNSSSNCGVRPPEAATMRRDGYHLRYLDKNPNGYCGTGLTCPVGVAQAE